MRTQKRGEKCIEIQALKPGESVLVHVGDRMKVSVESDAEGVSISLAFNGSLRTIPIYNDEGEWLAYIGPTREETT